MFVNGVKFMLSGDTDTEIVGDPGLASISKTIRLDAIRLGIVILNVPVGIVSLIT
jgi:hypothetical protein